MKTKALFVLVFVLLASAPVSAAGKVVHFVLDGTIHAITAEYAVKAIDHATEIKADAVIFQIETPGGVSESMRTIISKMIASPVPVIVYVAPSGSRGTSAGFYIVVASDVAAMAPGTHIGSAHPVFGQEGQDNENTKTMMKKATEDSVAYIKTLAERRGRNVKEAEKAVRDSISFTENEALKLGLIDVIAKDADTLLKSIDGKEIKRFDGSTSQLHLKDAKLVEFEMTKRQKFLSLLADPNITFILVGLGMLGLMIELYNPGLILPGVIGVVCLSLFFLSVQIIPVNVAGLVLIALAVILFVLELKIHSYGLLTIGGILSLALGATMLIDAPIPEMRITFRVIATIITLIGITMAGLLYMVISLHRTKPVTGAQGLLQEIGTAQTDINPEGHIFIHGEIWKAVSPELILKGEKVRIRSVDGLTLRVEKFRNEPSARSVMGGM
ncbi:MAG TPA: nodulation protein NfeD [Acidobacteriota bacterium]|nr:nodulation protein NfeD [Acidobacteriota bacterium]